jgi:hypothetical protein
MAIYSIDLDPNDGDGLEIKMQRYLQSTGQVIYFDGYTSVADIDLDGVLDVLVSSKVSSETGCMPGTKMVFSAFSRSAKRTTPTARCPVWPTCSTTAPKALPWICRKSCCTDIHVSRIQFPGLTKRPGGTVLVALAESGSTGSGYSPAVTFDFNGDGIQEILFWP